MGGGICLHLQHYSNLISFAISNKGEIICGKYSFFKDICECSEINSFEISTLTDIFTLLIGHSLIFGGKHSGELCR